MLSFLDTDLYKLTMQQAIRHCFPRASASYRLIDHSERKFPPDFAWWLSESLRNWAGQTACTREELEWLRGTGFFTLDFLRYLADYRFDPEELAFSVSAEGKLDLTIQGSWQSTVLWEVPLLATIHELYYHRVERAEDDALSPDAYYRQIRTKAERLIGHNCLFAEFGTRWRRSKAHQEAAVRACRDATLEGTVFNPSPFLGTSNLHFARLYQLRPFGVMAHEWIMAHSVFSDLETANRDALLRWMQIYGRRAATALTDTYTTALFFENFERVLAEAYTTLRHDSGDPFRFIDKALAFYEAMGIDAREKTILFSDRIDVEQAVKLKHYLGRRAQAAFALGTVQGREQLDLVIKLNETNGRSVCKLSDDLEHATGPRHLVEAIAQRVENHTRRSPHYPSY